MIIQAFILSKLIDAEASIIDAIDLINDKSAKKV